LPDPTASPIDLTLYRCIQEGITNAIRHGWARNRTVDLVEESGHRRDGAKRQQAVLRLTISDDGKGIDSGTPKELRFNHHDREGEVASRHLRH